MTDVSMVIVMGVAGAGKSTIGRLLAKTLNWTFLDADDFHPATNILKMSRGEPLTDTDRFPWLDAMVEALSQAKVNDQPVVLAASILKDNYRQRLTSGLPQSRIVYLSASPELIAQRLSQRADHFMKSDMLSSQFEALEEPNDALRVDAGQPPHDIVQAIIDSLDLVGTAVESSYRT